MKPWVFAAVLILAVLHQDVWLWGDRDLLGGVVPVGLAYHAAISMLATCLWFAVAHFAWPAELDGDEP